MRFGTGGGVGDRPADHNLAGGELCEPTARKRMLAAAAPLAGREASALTLELAARSIRVRCSALFDQHSQSPYRLNH